MFYIVAFLDSDRSIQDLTKQLPFVSFHLKQVKTSQDLMVVLEQEDIHMILLDGSKSVEQLNETIERIEAIKLHPIPFLIINTPIDKNIEAYYTMGAIHVLTETVGSKLISSIINNLSEHLDIDLRITISKALSSDSVLNRNDHLFSRRLFEVIHNHLFSKQLTIGSIARELGISRRQLLRRCYKIYNKSAFELLDETRLRLVHQMVEQEGVSVRSLAEDLGFSSPYYLEKKYEEFLTNLKTTRDPEH
jgi:AraC-like DNA-binding protein